MDKLDRPVWYSIMRAGGAALISAGALWMAARNTHVDSIRVALGRVALLWLLPYPLICVVLNIIRGEIWRQLLGRRVRTVQAFWAYSIGFLANNVLPFRVGEAARVFVLSTRSELPVIEVAAAAGLERLLDLAALSVMLVLIGPAVGRLPGLGSSASLVVALVAGAVLVLVALARFRDRLPVVVERAAGWLSPHARGTAVACSRDLVRGLTVLLRPRVGIPAAAGSLVVWILTIALQWLVLRAFQPDAGATDAALMVAAVSLVSALPAAPGFVGVYHLAGQQALVAAFPHRYDASTALAAATVAHAASYVTSTALGVIGLWYFGMPPSAMTGLFGEHRARIRAEDVHGREVESPAGIAN